MQISSDLEEVDYQLRSSSEDFPRRKGSIQCCDFGTFQEGSDQKLGLADEDLGNRRGEGLSRHLQTLCKDWEAGSGQKIRRHLRQGCFDRGLELWFCLHL